MLVAPPTPCSRTGFHMINISLWLAVVSTHVVLGAVAVAHEVPAGAVAAGVNAGSTMIMSPGVAASIAAWIDCDAVTCVGLVPPIVTVTVSIDCLRMGAAAVPTFPVVMINSPQRAVEPPYC